MMSADLRPANLRFSAMTYQLVLSPDTPMSMILSDAAVCAMHRFSQSHPNVV